MKSNYFLLIIIVSFLAYACDNIPDDTVSTNNPGYQLATLQAPSNFAYTAINTKFSTSIQIKNGSTLKQVYLDIRSADGNDNIFSHIILLDNGNSAENGDITAGDNYFSAIIPMLPEIASGKYIIEYFVNYELGKQDITQKIAVHQFSYDNGSANYAPIIADVIAPDTVVVTPPKAVIILSVAVSDSNGINDISNVYFITYRPDGTTNGNKSYLLDNGNVAANGDAIAGDGRYSLIIEVTPSNAKGEYTFEFRARDKGNKLSNIINHKIVIE
ncbi:MAG: hypothetical protein V1773_19080 [bacterium]